MKKLFRLNEAQIRRATKRGLLCDGLGLNLRITERQTKSWVFRFMLNGKAREMGLGRWPDRTLVEARKRAQLARQKLLDGIDPIDS